MVGRVEFFFDVLSPYAYIAYCRLPGLVKRVRGELVLRPVSLPRVLERSGNTPPPTVPARFAYIRQDIEALAKYYGLPLEWPALFPARTGRAMSVLTTLEGRALADLTQKLFHAYWVDGRDLGDEGVLSELVGAERLAQAAAPVVRERLDAVTNEAVARGAFGVPTLFVGDRMFFGNDRLFLVERALNDDG